MSDAQQQQQVKVEDLPREALISIVTRDQFVKEHLGARNQALTTENLEMLAIINQLQAEVNALREQAGARPVPDVDVPQNGDAAEQPLPIE